MKEILLHAIVGDEYVCKPVVIVICECHSQRTALLGGDARFLTNVRKRTIAVVVTRDMEWDTKHSKSCGGEWDTYCPPAWIPSTANILYPKNGDSTFTDLS